MTSLAATKLPQSLVPTFMLPIMMTIGTGVVIAFGRSVSGPLSWILAAGYMLGTLIWTRRSLSPAAVGAHFIAVHMALVFAATALSYDGRSECLPLGLCNPASMVIGVLGVRNGHHLSSLFEWSNNGKPQLDAAPHVIGYWLAMAVNILRGTGCWHDSTA